MVEDLVIGVKALAELEAKYTVSIGEVKILNQSQTILSCEEKHLVPDEETTIRCKLGKAPWKIQNVQAIAKVQVTNKQQYHTLRVKVQDDTKISKHHSQFDKSQTGTTIGVHRSEINWCLCSQM